MPCCRDGCCEVVAVVDDDERTDASRVSDDAGVSAPCR
jgi:hypothetical protein